MVFVFPFNRYAKFSYFFFFFLFLILGKTEHLYVGKTCVLIWIDSSLLLRARMTCETIHSLFPISLPHVCVGVWISWVSVDFSSIYTSYSYYFVFGFHFLYILKFVVLVVLLYIWSWGFLGESTWPSKFVHLSPGLIPLLHISSFLLPIYILYELNFYLDMIWG